MSYTCMTLSIGDVECGIFHGRDSLDCEYVDSSEVSLRAVVIVHESGIRCSCGDVRIRLEIAWRQSSRLIESCRRSQTQRGIRLMMDWRTSKK